MARPASWNEDRHSDYKTRRPLSVVAGVLLCVSLLLVATVLCVSLGSHERRLSTQVSRPLADFTPETEKTLSTARELERFHEEHRKDVLNRVIESTQADPQYKKGLLGMTEESVMSLKGFSEARKREMWKRIQDAQNAVKENNLDR